MNETLILSEKYKDFIRCDAPVEFLEGTTAAGKTTVALFKFMLKVAESDKKIHILSGLDLGTIEKNIINKDLGIIDDFGNLAEYNAGGKGKNSLPHILFHTSTGDKIIYVLGYDNKTRWKKALGGQYGCLYIDEINIADMEYVREASMRCDYLLGTLNPDNPELPIYIEYINHARPIKKYARDAPAELLSMLDQTQHDAWVWWYFGFEHNSALTQAKINRIIENVPVGTKLYKNKILGLRGKATGLVFPNFDRTEHVRSKQWLKRQMDAKEGNNKIEFLQYTAGLDTAYSDKSPDTLAMVFMGIDSKHRLWLLDESVYNNANLDNPLAPSDIVQRFPAFLEKNRKEYGLSRNTFIDSADSATMMELKKYKRSNGSLYIFNSAWKKMQIIDRINLQLNWIAKGDYIVLDHCKHHLKELDTYSWREDKDNVPEDANDHTINAAQYAWIPYVGKIGG